MPKIPRAVPILLLGGERDEVVPHEHMDQLWGLVKSRGLPPPSPSPSSHLQPPPMSSSRSRSASPAIPSSPPTVPSKEEARETQTDFRGNAAAGLPGTGNEGGREGRRQPRVQSHWETGSRYLEFPMGTHSESLSICCPTFVFSLVLEVLRALC